MDETQLIIKWSANNYTATAMIFITQVELWIMNHNILLKFFSAYIPPAVERTDNGTVKKHIWSPKVFQPFCANQVFYLPQLLCI